MTKLLPKPEPLPSIRRRSLRRKSFTRANFPSTSYAPRDHYQAVDFYLSSEGLTHLTESIGNLRRNLSIRRRKSEIKLDFHPKTSSIYSKRCRGCLQEFSECFCDNLSNHSSNQNISDWMKIITYDNPSKRKYSNSMNRLEWLEELEEESVIDKKQYLQKKMEKRDICCFPFSTFRTFNKKDLNEIDFYTKKSE